MRVNKEDGTGVNFYHNNKKPSFEDFLLLSGRRDSNPESPVPKTGMLAVTLHPDITPL